MHYTVKFSNSIPIAAATIKFIQDEVFKYLGKYKSESFFSLFAGLFLLYNITINANKSKCIIEK